MKEYVCVCGNVRLLKNPPRDRLKGYCLDCRPPKPKKSGEDLKRYTHICSNCPSVVVNKVAVRKSTLCSECSRALSKKPKPLKWYYDLTTGVYMHNEILCKPPKIRHFEICTECSYFKEVSRGKPVFIICKKCKSKVVKPQVVKPQVVKPVFQLVDLKTLEMPDEKKLRKRQEKEVYPKSTKEQDDAMIAEFLAKRAKGEI